MKKLLAILVLIPNICFAQYYYTEEERIGNERRQQYQADRDMYLAQQQRQNELLEEQNRLLQQAASERSFDRLERSTEQLRQENKKHWSGLSFLDED